MGTVNIPRRRRKTLTRGVYTTGTKTCCGGPDDKGRREGTPGYKSVRVVLFRAYIPTTAGPGEGPRVNAGISIRISPRRVKPRALDALLEFARNRVSAQSSGKFLRVTTRVRLWVAIAPSTPCMLLNTSRVGLAYVHFVYASLKTSPSGEVLK